MPPEPVTPSATRRLRKRHLVGAAALALMAFLALRSSPFMGELSWLPRWFTRWADTNWVFRSFVGFYAFGALWFALISARWLHVVALALFATAVEVAQIWIPRRVFDVHDITASVLGVVLAWIVVVSANWLVRRRQ